MKIRKLLSICALTLVVASCTSVSAQAAQVAQGNIKAEDAAKAMAKVALNDQKVVNGVNITESTVLNQYVSESFITEVQDALGHTGLQVDVNGEKSAKDVEIQIAGKLLDMTKEDRKAELSTLKAELKAKFFANEGKTDAEVLETAKKYFKVAADQKITVGVDSENRRVVALENNAGKILLLVTADEVDKAIDRIKAYSYEDVKAEALKNLDIYNQLIPTTNN